MLQYLFMLENYFEAGWGAVYEDDLIKRFGRNLVKKAVLSGLVERRCLPDCRRQRPLYIYSLSEDGRKFMAM